MSKFKVGDKVKRFAELEHFLLFKFMGHGGKAEILSKFDGEELNVDDFEISMNQ